MPDLSAILESLDDLPKDKREELDALIAADIAANPWRPMIDVDNPEQPTPQQIAFDSKADVLLYGGAAGGGKGLRPDCPVLTPFGWRPIGKLKVGDAVCATDGTVTKVIGVYHRGVQPLYRLTFADSSVIECDGDHIWQAWTARRSAKVGNQRTFGPASIRKWTAQEIAALYANSQRRLIIPVAVPPSFNVAGSLYGPGNFQRRTIPPYVLGVLLGDGCLSSNSATFATADDEIAERVSEELRCEVSRYEQSPTCSVFRIPSAAIIDDLKKFGLLGKVANEKFIPRIYLFGSVDERLALLQGLMDTDGTAEDNRAVYYTTVSKQLAEDVRHLARSLGAIVTITSKTPTYSYNGEKRCGQLAYTLRIKIPDADRVFHLERKKAKCRGKVFQCMGLVLRSIERAGEGETVCIAVAHPNSLFIVDNFIVTHNTDLLIGLALIAHKRSVIFRREHRQLANIIERTHTIRRTRDGFNGQENRFALGNNRMLWLGGMQHPGDEQGYQGQDRDLMAFDELTQFQESQFRYVLTWNRSTDPNQRCRVVAASNPPITAEGEWVYSYWAPWLDETYPNPALPGELRWFISDEDGEDREVDGPEPVEVGGEMMTPRSRTFIPSSVDDNPFLMATGYKANLQSLKEPLRSLMLRGDFTAGREDDAKQVIPSKWVIAAQNRWEDKPPSHPMSNMGVDVAEGGRDNTVFMPRYGDWYARPIVYPGKETEHHTITSGLVIAALKDGAPASIDVIGPGGAVYGHLNANNVAVIAMKGDQQTNATDRSGRFKFVNKRAEWYWKMREALDPDAEFPISLPPDPILRSDLCAPRWEATPRGLKIESKKDIIKRLGRSTDYGDACVYALPEIPMARRGRKRGVVQVEGVGGFNPHAH